MSYYYAYYMGVLNDEHKIVPIGQFDEAGRIYPVYCRSGSFASDLHDEFDIISPKAYSEEFLKYFPHADDSRAGLVKCLRLRNLPKGDFIKRGYYLIDDIQTYESDPEHDAEDLFYTSLTPTAYAERMRNAERFKLETDKAAHPLDEDKNEDEEEEHPLSNFAYYAYPDYHCKEWESHIIQLAFSAYDDEHYGKYDADDYVVIETEG